MPLRVRAPTRSPGGMLLNPSGFPGAPRKGPGRRLGQVGKVGKNPTQSVPGVPSSTYLRHQSIFGVGSGSPRKIWGECQPVAPFRWNPLGARVPGPGQLDGWAGRGGAHSPHLDGRWVRSAWRAEFPAAGLWALHPQPCLDLCGGLGGSSRCLELSACGPRTRHSSRPPIKLQSPPGCR